MAAPFWVQPIHRTKRHTEHQLEIMVPDAETPFDKIVDGATVFETVTRGPVEDMTRMKTTPLIGLKEPLIDSRSAKPKTSSSNSSSNKTHLSNADIERDLQLMSSGANQAQIKTTDKGECQAKLKTPNKSKNKTSSSSGRSRKALRYDRLVAPICYCIIIILLLILIFRTSERKP